MKPDALKDAVRYLAIRSRSEAEVRAYLAKHGHDVSAVDEAIEVLKQRRIIEDGALARGWASELAAEGKSGRAMALHKLMERGIPKDLAEESIEAVWQEIDEAEAAARLLRKKFRLSGQAEINEMARAARFLKSRGYGAEAISRALKETFGRE
ncbi:MAG: regulatory protein RecX [Firmicutes bacterium]|nr:regulatory protein RecX [Bacillota bacterium]